MRRCFYCFAEFPDIFDVCPACGNSVGCLPVPEGHLRPGTLLHGRYYVGTGAGEGGFGIVYRGFDTLRGSAVAVKELFPPGMVGRSGDELTVESTSPRSREEFSLRRKKFLSEAAAACAAAGEAGCEIYDCFSENGTAYIVMEYIEGETFAARISRGGTGPAEAAETVYGVCRIVSRLHRRGIVHLDIAPDNIILVNDNRNGATWPSAGIRAESSETPGYKGIKLIDFGAAELRAGLSGEPGAVFKEGYSAPELCKKQKLPGFRGMLPQPGGQTLPSSKRMLCDVYSLGATLFAALTARRPPDAQPGEAGATLFSREECDRIPVKIRRTVEKAMSYAPEDRFGSAEMFGDALAGAAAESGLDISSFPGRCGERKGRKSGKNSSVDAPGRQRERAGSPAPASGLILPGQSGALPPGTILRGRYTLRPGCRRAGACLEYEAEDLSLDTEVSVCEYMPRGRCSRAPDGYTLISSEPDFRDGVSAAGSAMQRYASFGSVPGFAGITDVFSENGTVYYVCKKPEGKLLRDSPGTAGRLGWPEICEALTGVAAFLCRVAREECVRAVPDGEIPGFGNVGPSTLVVTREGFRLLYPAAIHFPRRLCGFGSITPGFSPPEAYYPDRTGVSHAGNACAGTFMSASDSYSLAAVCWYLLTGKIPPDAPARTSRIAGGGSDPLVFGSGTAKAGPEAEKYLSLAMSPNPDRRYRGTAYLIHRHNGIGG